MRCGLTMLQHPGTYWYHGHHGLDHTGARALAGPLIVLPAGSVDHPDLTLFISDFDGQTGAHHLTSAKGGLFAPATKTRDGWNAAPIVPFELLLVNGEILHGIESNTSFIVQPNTTYRLRLINAGTSFPLKFGIDGHTLNVVATDGADTETLEVDSIHIHTAERYDCLVTTHATPMKYQMRISTLERSIEAHESTMIVEYKGASAFAVVESAWNTRQERVLNCFDGPKEGATGTCYPVTKLKRKHGMYGAVGYPDHTKFITTRFTPAPNFAHFVHVGEEEIFTRDAPFIQNVWPHAPPFIYGEAGPHMHPNSVVVKLDFNSTIQFIFKQFSREAHPFHMHGHKFYVMGQGFGDPRDCTITE